MFFRRISGVVGSVTIPALGLNIGTMQSWDLTRREETPPELGEWDLRAVFSYVNEFAFRNEGYEKRFVVTIGHPKKGKQLRLIPSNVGRTDLEGRSLLMEGCKIDDRYEADG